MSEPVMPGGRQVVVVGGGIFGCQVALEAARRGFAVQLIEARDDLLLGASQNNQNRLHLGFHYPRDLATGQQSILGFRRFVEQYGGCIRDGFPNAYFIARQGSFTTTEDYLAFCERLGEPYERIDVTDLPVEVRGTANGILCQEVVYDCHLLRELVRERLRDAGVAVRLRQRVDGIEDIGHGMRLTLESGERIETGVVVNCCYADIARLTTQLGHAVAESEFEYTVVPILELDIPKVGITIMDGPFMTLLPYGRSDRFLLYDVENTVVARKESSLMDPAWLDPVTAPFARIDHDSFYQAMRARCMEYVPALAQARLTGFLQGPRMVLARHHATDARPSIVNSYGPRYHTVFSGKIDHCVWVAEELCARIAAD